MAWCFFKKAKTLSFLSYLVSIFLCTFLNGSYNFYGLKFRVSSTFLFRRIRLLCSTMVFCAPLPLCSILFCVALCLIGLWFVWLVGSSLFLFHWCTSSSSLFWFVFPGSSFPSFNVSIVIFFLNDFTFGT